MKVLCVVIGFNHRFGRYLAIKGGSFQGVAFTIAIIYLLLLTVDALWFNRARQNNRNKALRMNSALKIRIRMDNEK